MRILRASSHGLASVVSEVREASDWWISFSYVSLSKCLVFQNTYWWCQYRRCIYSTGSFKAIKLCLKFFFFFSRNCVQFPIISYLTKCSCSTGELGKLVWEQGLHQLCDLSEEFFIIRLYCKSTVYTSQKECSLYFLIKCWGNWKNTKCLQGMRQIGWGRKSYWNGIKVSFTAILKLQKALKSEWLERNISWE